MPDAKLYCERKPANYYPGNHMMADVMLKQQIRDVEPMLD